MLQLTKNEEEAKRDWDSLRKLAKITVAGVKIEAVNKIYELELPEGEKIFRTANGHDKTTKKN